MFIRTFDILYPSQICKITSRPNINQSRAENTFIAFLLLKKSYKVWAKRRYFLRNNVTRSLFRKRNFSSGAGRDNFRTHFMSPILLLVSNSFHEFYLIIGIGDFVTVGTELI